MHFAAWWGRKSLAHNHCWSKIQSRCAVSNQRDSIEPMTQFAQQIHCQSGTPIIHPFTHSCSHYFTNCMSIYSILSYMQSVPHVLQHSLTASAPTLHLQLLNSMSWSHPVRFQLGDACLQVDLCAYVHEQKWCRIVDAHEATTPLEALGSGNVESSPYFLQRFGELHMQNLHD